MAVPTTRLEYKITLSHVDRGIDLPETAVFVSRHPSETLEHVTLRVLAWCLFHEEGISFGPGLSSDGTADLWVHDLTGRLTSWIECGATKWEHLRRGLQQNSGAKGHVVFVQPRKREDLEAEIAAAPHAKERAQVTLWSVDPALVAALAAREDRRQRWSVTIVGDHFYVEAFGENVDGEVARADA